MSTKAPKKAKGINRASSPRIAQMQAPAAASSVAPVADRFVISWPADQVERVALDELIPYARNPMLHTELQVAKIAASMEVFGWTNPVLRDESGLLIAGHGRVLAAALNRRKWPDKYATAPTMTARGWSEEKKKAYRIADNRLALDAKWDDELLRLELSDLQAAAFNLSVMGFDRAELKRMAAEDEPEGEPQAVPMERCPKCGALSRKIKP